MSKLSYFVKSAIRNLKPSFDKCPSCGSRDYSVVSRKFLVTALRRCSACSLLYRYPIEDVEDARRFYEAEYTQGFTTDIPDEETLVGLLDINFRGSTRDYGHYIEILSTLTPPPANVFEFGCSWGYGSWQLSKAGFNTGAFEISHHRGGFARDRIGVDVQAEFPSRDNTDQFDAVITTHVLEHVPSIDSALKNLETYVRPGGYIVAITPNGSSEWRNADFNAWNTCWGEVHPNFPDIEFYRQRYADRPYFISTTPLPTDQLSRWAAGEGDQQIVKALDAYELCVVLRVD